MKTANAKSASTIKNPHQVKVSKLYDNEHTNTPRSCILRWNRTSRSSAT